MDVDPAAALVGISIKRQRMSAKTVLQHDREIGRRLKMRRLHVGMSQGKLADALGLTFQQIQKYEKGVNRVGGGRLQEVARILDVPVSFFFDDIVGGSRDSSDVFPFLGTAYSLRMMKAFVRIRSQAIQRSAVELVEQIAGSMETRHERETRQEMDTGCD
ncbi:MAG: helix-turn-helix domain-containing protein [Xanthobacteraceae bacterium]